MIFITLLSLAGALSLGSSLSPLDYSIQYSENYIYNYIDDAVGGPNLSWNNVLSNDDYKNYDTTPMTLTLNNNLVPFRFQDCLRFTIKTKVINSDGYLVVNYYKNEYLEINAQTTFYFELADFETNGANKYYIYPCEEYDPIKMENGSAPLQYMPCFDKDLSRLKIGFEFPLDRFPSWFSNTDFIRLHLVFNALDPNLVQDYLYPQYDDNTNNAAYQNGYQQGVQVGYQGGLTDGYASGVSEGYQQGYQEGYHAGETGSEVGASYDRGYDAGYQVGYGDGYDYALDQGATASIIFNGFISVGLLPVNVFLRMLNFEVFGINIGAFVSSLLTICIIIIIMRMFLGGKSGE